MSESKKPWYWDRKAFRGNERLLDAVRGLDAELMLRHGQPGDEDAGAVYTFAKTNFGRVTWDTTYKRYSPLRWQYVDYAQYPDRELSEGHLVPASNMDIPALDESRLPRHVIDHFDIASLEEIDDGFEIFEGLNHPTSVYFVEAAFSGLLKIGIASHLHSRVSAIQSASQEPVSLICSVRGNRELEKFLHGVFEPLRHHGEWFYPHWSIYSVIMGLEG